MLTKLAILTIAALAVLIYRKFRKTSGTAAIQSVKNRFEALIDTLENGVAHNRQKSDSNSATIVALGHENNELEHHAKHGESIAQKLRELLGDVE